MGWIYTFKVLIWFQVAHSVISEKENLRAMFISLKNSLQVTDGDVTAAQDTLYKEIISKLCNIIQEFLLAQKQRYATVKGCASTAEQNLHEKLLSLHTNLQTHMK